MASLKFHHDVKRWRVFWHVTLPGGKVDKGSRSFKDEREAKEFKKHCEKRAKQLKRAIFVELVPLAGAFNEWLAFCQGYTKETRRLYVSLVNNFISDLPANVIYITDLTKFHINSHLNSLLAKGVINKTVNNSMSAIKSLCRYIHENYNIPNPASGIKKLREDPSCPHFLIMKEYEAMLKNSAEIARPWIRFIANTGLRVAEFSNLRWKNCDIKNKTITIIGKGRKKRSIGLNDTALGILKKIKANNNVKSEDSVFSRKNGKPLSRHCLSSYIGKACRNSGLAGGGPHAIRHFFATQLLFAGVPIIKVSILLGHSSVTTTQRHYSHILDSDLRSVTSILKAI